MNETIKTAITAAADSHYSEFASKIKPILKQKLSEHPEIANYSAELNRLKTLKQQFATINAED